MIELEFMTGNEPHMPFPPYVKAAGLTHRFTVLQENTFHIRVPDTTFDEAVWREGDIPAPVREPRWKSAVPWGLLVVAGAIYFAVRWFHLFGLR